MSFDIDAMDLDTTPLDGLDEAFDNWEEGSDYPPVIEPGPKTGIILEVEKEFSGPAGFGGNFTFELQGGEFEGRRIFGERLTSFMQKRGNGIPTNDFVSLIKSSGLDKRPANMKELAETVKYIQEQGKLLKFTTDLWAPCWKCGAKKERELLGLPDDCEAGMVQDARASLKDEEKRQFYKTVDSFRYPFRYARSIPIDPKTKKHVPSVTCPNCGQELAVRARIGHWLKGGA